MEMGIRHSDDVPNRYNRRSLSASVKNKKSERGICTFSYRVKETTHEIYPLCGN
jgi:hypothetical protein